MSVITLPPPGPAGHPTFGSRPEKTIEFTVENLPDNDYTLIREAVVLNKTTGDSRTERDPTDIDFMIDIPLQRNADNAISVQVRDINDRIITHTFTIQVR